MTSSDDAALRGEKLRQEAGAARSRAQDLVAHYHDLAQSIAVTEERVAETMDRLAAQQPARARRCRTRSQQAREQAALWRQGAARLG